MSKTLREDVSIHRTNLKYYGKSPQNSFFLLLSNFVAQYVLIIVVWFFLWKYILVFEKWYFRSTAQICKFSPWILPRVVWPHVTNLRGLQYFCWYNPLFYHLNLNPCHYWRWQRNIYFLENIFVRHTFSMSKSSIKTKTVLTLTDMTESTELLAFKRQKDDYKVTVKISLCICVVLSWDENFLASDYKI